MIKYPTDNDTIAAISTGAGEAGVSIVRLSGPQAFQITSKVFRRADGRPFGLQENRTIAYGHVVSGADVIDEALVTRMEAPRTYTREDVAEINCHGGFQSTSEVLSLVCSAGARPAEPGEFTMRAFLNGRIDLAQAEAVSGVIAAKTGLALKAASRQLKGALSDAVKSVKEEILALTARLEVAIQYPEYDDEIPDAAFITDRLRAMRDRLSSVASSCAASRFMRDGLTVAIAGRPNVGKSMLLNALVGRDRAIVADTPGTTRDVVEAWSDVGGVGVRYCDTAGIRDSDDPVEAMGVQRSVLAADEADLVFFVLDASVAPGPADEEALARLGDARILAVLNKTDLGVNPDARRFAERMPWREACAVTGDVAGLTGYLTAFAGAGDAPAEAVLASERQIAALRGALEAVEAALASAGAGMPADLVSTDMSECLHCLGLITGESATDEVVGEIFRSFCVGK